MLHGFPEYDPDGDGYIQGMFGAILRYFNGSVADIEGFLTDTMNLVAENECNGLTPTEWKRLQGYASRHLFDCPYAVSASTQTGNGNGGRWKMMPLYAVFGTKGGLVYFGGRRLTSDAT